MYKLLKNKKTKKFDIHEIDTGKILYSFEDYNEGRKRYRELQGGQGFLGWTPDYILSDKKYDE